MYTKCVTVRDKQLKEKKQVQEMRKMEEKRKDMMGEIERLKQIRYYDELDRKKKEEQIKGCMVVIDQIKERELVRLKEKEQQEIEGQEIVRATLEMQMKEIEQ